MRRLLLASLLLALAACHKEGPPEGAVKLTVAYEGFKPRCVRVSVRNAGSPDVLGTTDLTDTAGKWGATGGTLTVAILRDASWSRTLDVTAEAFEQLNGSACMGTSALRQTKTVSLGTQTMVEETLALQGQDTDGDGYVPSAMGGQDCDDGRADVHPGVTEVCNGRDDDCNGQQDEGFSVGGVCDGSNGCQGAWACDAVGGHTCQVGPNQWYPDVDKDGKGASTASPVTSCQQPAGYVPNHDDCDDNNPRKYVGAPELCNSLDDDCDGVADNGLGVTTACTGAGGCSGTKVCAPDAGVECNAPTPITLYADTDKDTYGGAASVFCKAPDAGYVANSTDCDDTDPLRHPGAPERCNSLDDNCDGTADEGFNLGASCTQFINCTGARACDVDGGVTCQLSATPGTWYPDDDSDNHGKQDAGVKACSAPDAGYTTTGNDCDDGDPFTYAGARELCDGRDNDCNGSPEGAGVCPASPAWTSTTVGSTGTWNALSLYGDGGVWVVGNSGGRAHKAPGATSFTAYGTGCTSGNWYSVWANPVTGKAYLGGASNALATQDVGSGTCTTNPPSAKDSTWGLVGFRAANGSVDIYGTGTNPTNNGGWSFRWDGSNTSQTILSVTDSLNRAHGLAPDVLFAVGGADVSGDFQPRIYRYNVAQASWKRDLTAPINGLDWLNSVWVVNSKLAYVGGDNGTVMKWDGTNWSALPTTPGAKNVEGVLAFGTSSVYAVTDSGGIVRFNGQAWEILDDFNVVFMDIKGTSPEDIWVVGANNRIVHWPK